MQVEWTEENNERFWAIQKSSLNKKEYYLLWGNFLDDCSKEKLIEVAKQNKIDCKQAMDAFIWLIDSLPNVPGYRRELVSLIAKLVTLKEIPK